MPAGSLDSVFHYPGTHFTFLPFPKWLGGIQVWIFHVAHSKTMANNCERAVTFNVLHCGEVSVG